MAQVIKTWDIKATIRFPFHWDGGQSRVSIKPQSQVVWDLS